MAHSDNAMYNNEVLDLSAGSVFGGHRIESVVGRGGMGVVYLAVHERLKQRRALKVIAPEYCRDEQFRRRFEREWEVAAAIDHPHVIPIYDAGEDEGQLYIAMRFVDGIDMRSLIAREERLDPRYAVEIVGQIASALDAAHARGLVHRDIKPANILISGAPGETYSYLTDFGLTKGVSSETSGITQTGVFVGTLDYIAPEQLDGVVTLRSDIYALGCLTYHALSGHVPYPQPTAPAKMWAHVHAPPPHLAVGSPELAEVVARALAKNPDDRFASAGDFAEALRAAVAGADLPEVESVAPDIGSATVSAERPRLGAPAENPDDTPATAGGAPGRASTPPGRGGNRGPVRRPIVAAAVLAILLTGGVAAAVISSGGGEEKKPTKGEEGKSPRPKGSIEFAEDPSSPVPTTQDSIVRAAKSLDAKHGAAGLTTRATERFGTGGVVEYTKPGTEEARTYPMALNRTLRFVPTAAALDFPTVGSKRRDFSEYDDVARKFVRSVRDRRCAEFFDVAYTREDRDHMRAACARLLDGAYARAGSEWRSAPRVDLFRIGGTANLSFYGVRARGVYRTIAVEGPGGGIPFNADTPVVLSLFPPQGIPVKAKS
jgi:serine/threonine protein kinase